MKLADSSAVVNRPTTIKSTSDSSIRNSLYSCDNMRLKVAMLLCMGATFGNIMRNNIGMALVCMVNNTISDNSTTTISLVNTTTIESTSIDKCAQRELPESIASDYEGTIEWTSSQQATIIATMFYGSILGGLPGGFLADRYGAYITFTFSFVCYLLGTGLIPVFAQYTTYWAVAILRFVIGIGFGVHFTSINSLISMWYAQDEKTSVTAMWSTGNQLGSFVVYPMGTLFCSMHNVLDGWPLIFYSSALLGLIYHIIFAFTVTSSPFDNRFVGKNERKYLMIEAAKYQFSNRKSATSSIPWRRLLTSPQVWCAILMNLSASLYVFTLSAYMPLYFKQVLKMDIRQNGLFSALPFITQLIGKWTSSIVYQQLVKYGYNKTILTRIFSSIAVIGSSVCMICLSFVECENPVWGPILLALGLGFIGFNTPGFMTSMVTIAPAFSGIIMSMARLMAGISGITGPYLVSGFVADGRRDEWQIVFIIISIFSLVTGAFYACCGSTLAQEWALPKQARAIECHDGSLHPSGYKSAPTLTKTNY